MLLWPLVNSEVEADPALAVAQSEPLHWFIFVVFPHGFFDFVVLDGGYNEAQAQPLQRFDDVYGEECAVKQHKPNVYAAGSLLLAVSLRLVLSR